MKKSTLTKDGVTLGAMLLLCSCHRANEEFARATGIFFLGVIQLFNMIFLGGISLVFSILSGTSYKPTLKAIGAVLLVLFTTFTLLTLFEVNELGPSESGMYIIYLISFVMIIVASVFIFLKKKPGTAKQVVLNEQMKNEELL